MCNNPKCKKTKCHCSTTGHALCGPNCSNERPFEKTCEEELFDFTQIRYKIGCDQFSNLENLNISVGDNLDYITEVFGKRIQDFEYLQSPYVPNMPSLDTYEKVINYLFAKIADLQNQINNL